MLTINGFEILETSPEYFWFLAVLSVLAVSISKAGFGGALGSLSVPILIFVLPPKQAIGVLLPLFLVLIFGLSTSGGICLKNAFYWLCGHLVFWVKL